jgi:type I restriction enzyme M protein
MRYPVVMGDGTVKALLKSLKFSPKEKSEGVFQKKYAAHNGYTIEVDFKREKIDYGKLIKSESKTTQNFSQAENWVVLECVDRLLEKGYAPQNIILEKTYPAGHGTSDRLDVCVTRGGASDADSEYLLIECKTYGKEFGKALGRMKKDGGQLFTYFKFSNKPDLIMLYTSELRGKEIVYRSEIVKIEDDHRSGGVKDFYERWNKLTCDNGVFEEWVKPYNFKSRALTINDLTEIKQEDSSFIFNQFLEILRHNVVSDKGNAFNRIFTLFLCKIYDEKDKEGTEAELDFQWLENIDDHSSFQLRLSDLYKNGMSEFLEKVVTDFSETEFNNKFPTLDDKQKEAILDEFRKIRLEKNNEFAIKDVYDKESFNENALVVKEIVQLLQRYKLRYAKKQQYLSDFFELLLTTGLKQESGQFFTPVPVAQFIIKSLPVDKILEEKLSAARAGNDTLLPYVMDYAAGSGHFVTEIMNEIQRLLQAKNDKDYPPGAAKKIRTWKDDLFSWAINYIYGVEKDYRLVKVGKVGCYLHGDGLANVIHSDGLARFGHPDYKGKLLMRDKDFQQDNKQFDILISNPPYSVSAFKNNAGKYYTEKDFELYAGLTDNSSEIECLFVERAKQLLKDGGVAGLILPSSILTNEGIYTKAREIILQYFEIIAITELGGNTFMATSTNTVVLFLRRRNNYDSINLRKSLERFFDNFQDVTHNGIENPAAKYVNHVWKNIGIDDYITMLKKEPNDAVTNHEIYKEYRKKIKEKTEKDFWNVLIETEKEKLLYFILAHPQKVVLVKTGEKNAEKRFLGYEFSNRRGSEGIHPVQRGKTIDQCTRLFDDTRLDNPEKASTYIYKAFSLKDNDEFPEIHEGLKNNILRVRLIDMLTFDRNGFDKSISLAVKKKIKIESKWEQKKLSEIVPFIESGKRPEGGVSEYLNGVPSLGGEHINLDGTVSLDNMKFIPDDYFIRVQQGVLEDLDVLVCKDGALTGKTALFRKELFPFGKGMINEHIFILRTGKTYTQKYLFTFLFSKEGQELLKSNITGAAQGGLNRKNLLNIQIPLPPRPIQEKIIAEIEAVEKEETAAKKKIANLIKNIDNILEIKATEKYKLGDILTLEYGAALPEGNRIKGEFPVMGSNGIVGYHNEYLVKSPSIIVGRKGSAGKITYIEKNCFPIDTAFYVKPINNQYNIKLIYYALQKADLENLSGGIGVPGLNRNDAYSKIIFLPPLPEQQKAVSEINAVEAQIAEAQKILDAVPERKHKVLKKHLQD